MKTKSPVVILLILAFVLFSISCLCVYMFGRTITIHINVGDAQNVNIAYDNSVVELVSQARNNDDLELNFRGMGRSGSTLVHVTGNDEQRFPLYVHNLGIITVNNYLGRCNGDISFVISCAILFLVALIILLQRYRISIKRSICRYANIGLLGLIIFAGFLLLWLAFGIVYDVIINKQHNASIMDLVAYMKNTSLLFLTLLFPVVLFISIIITGSNIVLLKREGVTWRNMLGLFLGFVLCFSTLFVTFLSDSLFRGMGSFFLGLYQSVFGMFIAYLECLLIATIILAVKAAFHIPSFDKDYILILGGQIRKDGTLTRLMQSRADRAVEFAKMQRDANGKDIVFVPSGGQGSDEVISEAEAIKNYLISTGVSEDNILLENKSVNTYQNIEFSSALINEQKSNANIAFSTTNYHVFRAGCIADEQNVKIEGIGAKTKSYFWINAFIREFIATLYTEKRNHIRMIIAIVLSSLLIETILHFSIII